MVSNPITCCSVMRWASTPRGMECPQHKKTEGAFRPLERGFPITSVHRDDLESQGYDASKVTDDQMAEIADHMANAYCDDPFWVELEAIADDMEIPRRADKS